MGYTTDFSGQLKFNRPVEDEDFKLVNGLAGTRRMKRKVDPKYGVDGEFYIEGSGPFGQGNEDNIVDHNTPPETQPGLWLQWIICDDREHLEWDGNEKFYNYVEWLEYLIEKIFEPRDYKLNGEIEWIGEDPDDRGMIRVVDNKVTVYEAKISFVER